LLLAIYYLWDRFLAYPREAPSDVRRDEIQRERLRIAGLGLNGVLLAGVILSVALLDPSKPVPGTDWHAWLYLREAVQLILVAISLAAGSQAVRVANRFNFLAIMEVAALFLGIFICMQPALQILAVRGPNLGIHSPAQFFWATGALSAVLDNAPTYLVFFQTAQTLTAAGESSVAGVTEPRLAAISLGAVFMGAMTYIGNGPNFMVKAIAESAGVKMPGFFGYMLYSCAVLLPVLLLVTLVFFRGA
jgi:Na+/H+ antiporter NhaD/arsenite permease-like protein